MERSRLRINTISSFFYQIVVVVCGFILPRIILSAYGSEINGLIGSVTQFIQVINLFDFGVTSVLAFNLFEPLANHDKKKLSGVIASGDSFFSALGKILGVYIILLSILYPLFFDNSFGFAYTTFLILIMGIDAFGRYYFGVVDRILLIADQKNYVPYITQSFTLIANVFVSYIIVLNGGGIHIVKFIAALLYLIRPVFYRLYISFHYDIERGKNEESYALEQKWNGMAQHISAYILENTDIIILTIWTTLETVSIYHIYYLVISGIRGFFYAITNSISSVFGKIWAEKNYDKMRQNFLKYEMFIYMLTIIVWGATSSLIVDFVDFYTKGIQDANYHQPIFGILISISAALYCIRIPYSTMILVTGKYKETQKIYIVSTLSNIVLSVVLVRKYGLIGVILGTILALIYQVFGMNDFVSKKLLNISVGRMVKLFCCSFMSIALTITVLGTIYNIRTDNNIITRMFLNTLVWGILPLSIFVTFYYLFEKRMTDEL
ncbi:MAG: polysaccharide biosynthesis C-terminal domain-containing protein [Lachnospiraceae bacterium]|nr:polysaccharide biosynthesis C-terminal domain-containing protein [Lachnospiraceae bacterium]